MKTRALRNGIRGGLAAAFALLAAGCASVPVTMAPDFSPPAKVAVLPVANEAVDTDGPVIFRKLITEKLMNKGYEVVDQATVDEVLRDKFDIEEGGQLNAADAGEVAKAIGVDAVLYATVTEWEKHTLYVYDDIFVGGRFELQSKDAVQLWYVEHYKIGERQIHDPTNWKEATAGTVANLAKSYEPFAVRLIDVVFGKLPDRQ